MSWDQTWQLRRRRLKTDLQTSVARVKQTYVGVEAAIEEEAADCVTVFFTVPTEADIPATVEISLYEMEKGRYILSLEADAADNNANWDDAAQLAEDLADALGAEPLDL